MLPHPTDTIGAGGSPDIEQLIERMTNLPSPPTIIAQALRVTESEEQSAAALAGVLEADHAFTARLLRVSNSAFYGMAHEIYTALDAIIIIGFEAVRSLAISAAAIRGIWVDDELFNTNRFWGHSLTCGLFAEAIAKRLRHRKPEVAFTLGVIHDIGRIVMIQCVPSGCRDAIAAAQREQIYLWKAERKIIGFDHGEVGARMAETWKLPAAYSQAIRYHHDPEAAGTEKDLTFLLALANAMSHHAFTDTAEKRLVQPLHRGFWEPIGLTDKDVHELLELRPIIYERARVFYETITG